MSVEGSRFRFRNSGFEDLALWHSGLEFIVRRRFVDV